MSAANIPPTYRRSAEIVAANLGAKSFLLHITDWVYLELNDSGSRIWNLLEEGPSLDAVTDRLVQEFDVERETCWQQVSEFLGELAQKHFVVAG